MTTLRHPDDLSDVVIQDLGKRYLTAHEKSKNNPVSRLFFSLSHTNENTAIMLKSFQGEYDAYTKWNYLIKCYANLNSVNGELSDAIIKLFTDAFRTNIGPYKMIQQEAHRTPQEMANVLKVLVDSFYINQLRHQVKKACPDFDKTYSHSNSKLIDNPTALSNADLHQLGQAYLDLPLKQKIDQHKFFSRPYLASEVIALKLKNYKTDTDSYEKWIALAETYASLKESKGPLANAILHLFLDAFGNAAYTRKSRYLQTMGMDNSSPLNVAEALKALAVEWYAEKYRQAIRMDQGAVLKRSVTSHAIDPSSSRTEILSPRAT